MLFSNINGLRIIDGNKQIISTRFWGIKPNYKVPNTSSVSLWLCNSGSLSQLIV